MVGIQADLFAEDRAERNRLTAEDAILLRQRLEATLARLETAQEFPWADPLDAVHEENRFQRGADMLGEDGVALWTRFDQVMDRLQATRD